MKLKLVNLIGNDISVSVYELTLNLVVLRKRGLYHNILGNNYI